MSTTIDDIFYEQYLEDQHFSEKIEEGIEKYKKENLEIFYLQNSHIYKKILEARKVAQNLEKHKFLAPSFIYFSTCIELTFREMFVLPIIYGVVLDDEIAEIIISEIFEKRVSRFDKLLLYFVEKFGGLNLIKMRVDKKNKNGLWQEVKELRKIRNDVVHKGIVCKKSELIRVQHLVTVLLENIIPKLIIGLGLKINKENLIIEA